MERITTPEGVLLYPALLKPRNNEFKNREEYSCVLVFPAGTDINPLREAVAKAAKEGIANPSGARNPLQDGNSKIATWGAIMKDATFIRISSIHEPLVVDAKRQVITREEDVYSGCYARALVNPYAYDNKMGKGVGLGLVGVQVTRDGERIGGGRPSPDVFDEVPGGKTASVLDDPFA